MLGQAWWDKTRKEAYASTDWHCLACGVFKRDAKYHKWLEGHEIYLIDYVKGRAKYIRTVPLCHFCHNYIHDGRLRHLLQKGEIHHAKFTAIIQHGDAVLAAAGLARLSYEEREQEAAQLSQAGRVAHWGRWRLVIGRKQYLPKFKNYTEWAKAHGV